MTEQFSHNLENADIHTGESSNMGGRVAEKKLSGHTHPIETIELLVVGFSRIEQSDQQP